MTGTAALSVADMRDEFDRAFANPIANAERKTEDYLSILVDGHPYAIPMAAVGALHTGVKISAVPTAVRELLGVATLRGTLVPVYDLGLLLGHAASATRWLLVARIEPVAFAFDSFDRHFRLDAASATVARDGGGQNVHGVVRSADRAWPLIDLQSVIAAVRQRVGTLIPSKE